MNKENLVEIREDHNFTQEDIAKILNTSQSNYSRWENGVEIIPLKKLNTLCNYFNLSMDYILGLSKDNHSIIKNELDKKAIGQNLKKFRIENDLTQTELADFLKTTQSTISAYEAGKTMILTSFLIQIVKKYNITIDKICNKIN